MSSPFGAGGTAGSTRLAGTIAGTGPPGAGTGPWELLDIVIDSAGSQWLNTAAGTWMQLSGGAGGGGGTTVLNGADTAKPAAAGVSGQFYLADDSRILYYSDGTAWQAALSQADGISAPQPPVVYPNETNLIAPGAALNTVTASGGLTITLDTTSFNWGTSSIKCVSDGAGGSGFLTVNFGTPVDLSDKCLRLGVEIDSFTPYSDLQIRLSSDGFASGNFDYCKPIYSSGSQRWVEAGIWETVTIGRGAATGTMGPGQYQQAGTGLASSASVNAIRFKFVDLAAGPMTVRLGFLSYFTRPPAGIVSITFDDSRLSQFTVAKPVMDKYGIRGTVYNIGYNIAHQGEAGLSTYFNDTQMLQLQNDSHWEMGAHAWTDATGVMAHTVAYDSLSTHDGEIDLLQLKTWMRQQQALGIDSMALPHGQWSLNLLGISNPNPDVLGMMGKYFNTCVTTAGTNCAETYPPANRLKIRRYVWSNTDTAATMMALVNAAITNHWWLIIAAHNIVASPVSTSDVNMAEFQSFIPQLATAIAAAPGALCLPVGEVWRMQPGAITLPAGDLGGTAAAPVVAKIQGTAITAPPGGTSAFLAGNGTWQTPAGGGGISPPAGDIGGSSSVPTVAKIQGTVISAPPGGTSQFLAGNGTWQSPAGGSATTVAATDASIVVTGTGTSPLVATGTLDVVAAQHPAAADWSNNSHKITALATGAAPGEAAHWGQLSGPSPSEAGLLAWVRDPADMGFSLAIMATAGTVYISSFINRKIQTFTNMLYYVNVLGATLTSGQCFAGIYDSAGTLRATTADQSVAWTTTGLKTAALVTPYVSAPVGTYYFAFFFNGTTSPRFIGSPAPASMYNAGLSGASLRAATTSSTGNTTALPSSITLSANSGTNALAIWGAIT